MLTQTRTPADQSSVFGPVISSYSRKQALADGLLVDVSATDECKEAGFKFPVALTQAAWEATVAAGGKWVPAADGNGEELKLPHCQDVKGRLWDVLWMLKLAIRASKGGDTVHFSVIVLVDGVRRKRLVKLWSRCGPGDDAEPVITVMVEGED